MSIDRVLYPTDFSETAAHAGSYACLLARKLGARLHVLHIMVFPLPSMFTELTGLELARLYEEGRQQAAERLEEYLRGEEFQGLKIQMTTALGVAEDEILKVAARERSDLIVMGTHGRTGITRAFSGSVTEKVVRMAPCPVLAVKHPKIQVEMPWGGVYTGRWRAKEMLHLRKILVALDGSPLAEGVLPQVKELTRSLDSETVLLRVAIIPHLSGTDPIELERRAMEEAGSYLEAKRRDLGAEGFKVETAVRSGEAAEQILEQAEAFGVDLIAMVTHGRSGLKRWLLGSVAEKVLHGSDVPVLLYRAWKPPKN